MGTHPELLRDVTEVSPKMEDEESLDDRECILVCLGSVRLVEGCSEHVDQLAKEALTSYL
jgi:hypothetical protein